MAMETLSVDDAVPTTTADAGAQLEQAAEELNPSSGVDVAQSEGGDVAPDDLLGADASTQNEAPAEEKQEAAEDTQEAKPEADEALGNRASKRVQTAVNRAKEAELKLAELQAQHQQQVAYLQYQMQQQMAEQQKIVREQQAFYRSQAEAAAKRQALDELAKLSPAQKIEREWLDKAKRAALDELKPQLEQQQRQLAEERAYRERMLKAAQERQMLETYKSKADTVNRSVLFKDLGEKDVSNLNSKAQELLLTWGTAAGEEPEQAVVGFKKFLDDYYQARLRSVATKSGAKLKQSTSTPKPVPSSKGAPAGEKKDFKYNFRTGKWGF